MNEKVENYINRNKVCNANIFRDWEEFLHLLFECNEKVEMIVWYDYCKIEEQDKSLGRGGYLDSQNSGCMWAETQIYETKLQDKSLEEIRDYITAVRVQYPNYNVYPEFYIKGDNS